MAIYILIIPFILWKQPCNDVKEQGTNPDSEIIYTMPEESEEHEGTWPQWPHHYQYGKEYRNSLDPTWVAMTSSLVSG